jgi:hypothetical protein
VTGDPRASIKHAAGWALVAGPTVAALTAASGAALRSRPSGGLVALGTGTAGLSGLAFVLLAVGLWTNTDDWGSEGTWRAFGCSAVLAVAGAHACLVLGARRPTDSDALAALVFGSLAFAVLDTVGAILPISGLMEDVDDGTAKLLAATLVLLVLTSVLQPLLRRLQRPSTGSPQTAVERLASEVETIARRIDELNRGPSVRAPEIRREVERLRRLARSFQA